MKSRNIKGYAQIRPITWKQQHAQNVVTKANTTNTYKSVENTLPRISILQQNLNNTPGVKADDM